MKMKYKRNCNGYADTYTQRHAHTFTHSLKHTHEFGVRGSGFGLRMKIKEQIKCKRYAAFYLSKTCIDRIHLFAKCIQFGISEAIAIDSSFCPLFFLYLFTFFIRSF